MDAVISGEHLGRLFEALQTEGFQIVGPRLGEGAIVLGRLNSPKDLPAGLSDVQQPGRYRIACGNPDLMFSFGPGPDTWRRFLFPTPQEEFACTRTADGWDLTPTPPDKRPLALFGVRACDIHAIRMLDRIFLGGEAVDPHYRARRTSCAVIAVNCTHPGGNCFCASLGTGPTAEEGFDLCLTELAAVGASGFLVQTGSDLGDTILDQIPLRSASETERAAPQQIAKALSARMRRLGYPAGLQTLIPARHQSPVWQEAAKRCTACGSCTLVCPTCFCTDTVDTCDLAGDWAKRVRIWGSCFSRRHSYIHGGPVRASVASRYRQWVTHKFAAWVDQFGRLGCVGCGRCITWCPVGIDVLSVIEQIRNETPGKISTGKGE